MIQSTKTEVYNTAAGMLGQTQITLNPDTDTSTVFRIFRMHYRKALYDTIEKHPWTAYSKRQPLALIDKNPTKDWAYVYAIPEDCAVVNQISPDDCFPESPYAKKFDFTQARVGNTVVIFTNIPNAWAKYTALPDENESFPSYIADAIAANLAMRAAPAIITNNYMKIKDALRAELKNTISESIAIDLQKQPDNSQDYSPTIHARIKYDY